jgi:hypothetical protein
MDQERLKYVTDTATHVDLTTLLVPKAPMHIAKVTPRSLYFEIICELAFGPFKGKPVDMTEHGMTHYKFKITDSLLMGEMYDNRRKPENA